MLATIRSSHLRLIAALAPLLLAAGCTPQIHNFQVAIPGTPPAPQGADQTQGTVHVCPGSSVQLSWDAAGKTSLSATAGPRYQPPACMPEEGVPQQGSRTLGVSGGGSIGNCSGDSLFRLTAAHDFFHFMGPCPGHGCPNADREIVVSNGLDVPAGGRTVECAGDAFTVLSSIASTNWDNVYRVQSVTAEGSAESAALAATPGRTLTVTHDGKQAVFQAGSLSSDAFRGSRITGDWSLKLSGCASPPPALTITIKVSCGQ